MKNNFLYLLVLILGMNFCSCKKSKDLKKNAKAETNDWFINQRLFPYGKMDYMAYQRSIDWRNTANFNLRMNGAGNQWQFAGCVNVGGRITDVEMHESSLQTMYLGAASGGVFKSSDAGLSWIPVFDDQTSLSIGDMAIAPSNPDIIYVGTGEANGGGGSLTYDGNGVYKSIDAGVTWSNVGLQLTRNTGRIAIHPANPDIVYAATMGDLFGNNQDRGLYRTTNGGITWQQVLYATDSTGAIEVVIDPVCPDTVYATLWERVRRPDRRNYGGPSSGIYRSYDGGANWTKLTNGLPSGIDLGRIGIDVSKSNHNILYATVTDYLGSNQGIFKSVDYGNSWIAVTNNFIPNTSSYWYGRIKIDPLDPDIVYEIDFDLWKTTDGGSTWSEISAFAGLHVDQHEVYIHPQNNDLVLLGNDGGMHISYDAGSTWTHDETLPITQFYTCEMDESNPTNLYGGTQDNGVNCTLTGNEDDWFSILGGDGFVVLVDPANSSLVYAEYQYAGLNTGTTGIDPQDRINWNTPFVFNPLNSNSLYLGTDKVYKTIDNGTFWFPISPDLTNGSGTASYPIVYGTITTLAVAPSDSAIIYAGTDDGNIQVTFNEGASWNLVNSGLPYRWVTRIAVDPVDPLIAWATLSGYRYHDNMSHIYKTTDAGTNWLSIGANLPDVPVNDIIYDQTNGKLYIASDIGVFFTDEDTLNWQLLGNSMPVVPVLDIRLHEGTRTLLAATYGRSMYKYDLNYLISSVTAPVISTQIVELSCFPDPFNTHLNIQVYASENQRAKIEIVDINGKLIHKCHDNILTKGLHTIEFNNTSNMYNFKPGIYFVLVKTTGSVEAKKVVYIN